MSPESEKTWPDLRTSCIKSCTQAKTAITSAAASPARAATGDRQAMRQQALETKRLFPIGGDSPTLGKEPARFFTRKIGFSEVGERVESK